MSLTQRIGAVMVALFALAFTRAPALIRALSPLMAHMLGTRLPGGPNVALIVRGRKTGVARAVPVSFLDLGDRALVQASSADAGWVRNLRVSNEAMVTRSGRRERFTAVEFDPETAGQLLHRLLAPFPRSRLVRAVVGPVDRPPVGVLHRFRLRIDDTLEEYVALARRQPIFELRRPTS